MIGLVSRKEGLESTLNFLKEIDSNESNGIILRIDKEFSSRPFVSRKYLDIVSDDIYNLKGRINGDYSFIEWSRIRKVTSNQPNERIITTEASVKRYEPTIAGKVLITAKITPKKKGEGQYSTATLIVNWADCFYRVSKEIHTELIESIMLSAICRSVIDYLDGIDKIEIAIDEILVHSIDTSMELLDYLTSQAIFQLFQKKDSAPTVIVENSNIIRRFRGVHTFLKFKLEIIR